MALLLLLLKRVLLLLLQGFCRVVPLLTEH
jgi:hypothetical protein